MKPGDSGTGQEVRLGGPSTTTRGEDITWPDQVAPRGRKASSTRKIKPQTSNLKRRALGAGVWVWGPNTVPLACMPCGGSVPRGWWGGRPRGGWPATVVRGVWCQALSLPLPPVLWSGQPGFRDPCVPGAVGAGVGTQHRPHSVRPCRSALLAVGVAEGRPRGGCLEPL